MTGLALVEPPAQEEAEQLPTHSQVVRDLALDLQLALARSGRAPFVLSGLPMFKDLCAIRHTLKLCLTLREHPHVRHWDIVLDQTLPAFQSAFDEVVQALEWVNGISEILDAPLPTAAASGSGGNAVARSLAHHLGQLANIPDLTPGLTQFRDDLFALSERYWSGLFHCYDIVGLPPTNNDQESLYGQTKRQLRRQLGVSQLREPLLRRGAWATIQLDADSSADLRKRLAQVSWEDYAAERARYDRRQQQFRRRYRWRHHRDAVLQKRVADWAVAVPDC